MEKVRDYLFRLGYTKDDINSILNSYNLNGYSEDGIIANIKSVYIFFINLGFGSGIKKIIKTVPAILSLKEENLKEKVFYLKTLGYSSDDIKKITKALPHIYTYSIDNIKNKIENLMDLGYSRKNIIKMTKLYPQIYSLNIENIKSKLLNLESLGYSHDDIIEITSQNSNAFSYNIDTIKNKINVLIDLGYTKEEVLKITISLPSLLGSSMETIKSKINFYKEIGIYKVFINDAKCLIQGIGLSYARYMFYKENGIIINKDNYRDMFIIQKRFEQLYGLDSKTLIELYNYDDYMKNKNKQNI